MLETIYNNFVNEMLPKIQEGLSITKDYFMDLFGRYIHYLIIMDSIKVGIGVLITIGIIPFLIKSIKNANKREWNDESFLFFGLACVITIIGVVTITCNIPNLIKDLYIPEIRVIEELKQYNQ